MPLLLICLKTPDNNRENNFTKRILTVSYALRCEEGGDADLKRAGPIGPAMSGWLGAAYGTLRARVVPQGGFALV
jgi:hypothetical protein